LPATYFIGSLESFKDFETLIGCDQAQGSRLICCPFHHIYGRCTCKMFVDDQLWSGV